MRWLRCSVVLVSCLFFCETALALDPLLVEFGWSQPNPVTLPANYTALLGSTPWDTSQTDIITGFPTTQFGVADSVAFWNQRCTYGTACSVGFSNGGQQPTQFIAQFDLDKVLGGPNRLWADGWDGNAQPFVGHTGTWHDATYVPQKGNGNQALYGYQITAVEREVTATTQTIRLYGVNSPVPEPSTFVLGLFGFLAHLSGRFPRRMSLSRQSRC
jgi:hypothetical protein